MMHLLRPYPFTRSYMLAFTLLYVAFTTAICHGYGYKGHGYGKEAKKMAQQDLPNAIVKKTHCYKENIEKACKKRHLVIYLQCTIILLHYITHYINT